MELLKARLERLYEKRFNYDLKVQKSIEDLIRKIDYLTFSYVMENYFDIVTMSYNC